MLRAGVKKISQDRREAVKVLLNSLESFLEKSEWFAGDELTVADLAILASVGTIKVCVIKILINDDCLSICDFISGLGCELW